jgi:propanediol dehydratase large subunit
LDSSWSPPFASRELINDYESLRVYLEIAKSRGREDLVERALLSQEDFTLLSDLAKRGLSVLDLMEALKSRFMERVDGDIAREAFKALGLNVSSDFARERLAYILAGWLLEAGKHWRILSFKGLPPS